MATITANEYYEIRLSSLVSNVDKDVIIELYQPLVGAISAITYLTLVKQKRNEDDEDVYKMENLLTCMQISAQQFLSARRSLEAVGLLKTYEAVNGDIHTYIYELFAPKTPREFFDDILFRGLLIQYIGEKEVKKLAEAYEIDTNINKDKYVDISASFVDVFNPDYDSVAFGTQVGDNIVGHRTKKITTDIDIDLVLKHIEENSQIKKESLMDNINDIRQLATLFGLDEEHIAMVIIDSYNPVSTPHLNMSVAYNKAKEKAHYPIFKKGSKKKYTKSDINSENIIAQKVKLMDETPPAIFLEYLQGGTKAGGADILVVASLMSTFEFPYGLVNAVVDYTLQKKNNVLDKFFAERAAAAIAREGITNTLDAMNFLKKIGTKKTYKPNNEGQNSQTFKEPVETMEKVNKKVDNNVAEVSDEELQALLDTLK